MVRKYFQIKDYVENRCYFVYLFQQSFSERELMNDKNFPFDLFIKNPLSAGDEVKTVQKPTATSDMCAASSSQFSEEELNIINQEILSHLQQTVPEAKFTTFFEKTFALNDIKNGQALFLVSTNLIKIMISNGYIENVKAALLHTLGEQYSVEISVSAVNTELSSNNNNILNSINKEKTTSFYEKNKVKPKFTLSPEPQEAEAITKRPISSVAYQNEDYSRSNPSKLIDPKKTFESFISGPSNNLAYASAYAIATNPGSVDDSKSLYIYSDPGLGKTHLLHAIANKVNAEKPELVLFFISATDFIHQFVKARLDNTINDFMKKYTQDVDILMIDDIHGLSNKEGTQDVFFQVFNSLYENKKQLVFTSDKTPKEIDGLPKRLKSRFQGGLVIDIQRPDFETKIAILKSYAQNKDVFIQDSIIELMASAQTESIRELEGFINRFSLISMTLNTPIDEATAVKFLDLENTKIKKITVETVTKLVAQHYKLIPADIRSAKRTKELATARHLSIYLTKKHTTLTLNEIGKYFGGRNHSTVLTSINKIETELKSNLAFFDEVANLERKLH